MSFADVDMLGSTARAAANGASVGGTISKNGALAGIASRLRMDMTLSQVPGNRVVYRALRPEPSVVAGWSQAPCGHCPRFDFCADDGPINPVKCLYFEQWFTEQGEGHREKPEDYDEEDADNDQLDGGAPLTNIGLDVE
jgi:hypothetical protein